MKKETKISVELSGVMRCCALTVGADKIEGKGWKIRDAKEGDIDSCSICHREFEAREIGENHFKWFPLDREEIKRLRKQLGKRIKSYKKQIKKFKRDKSEKGEIRYD